MATNKLAISMALVLCVFMVIGCSTKVTEASETDQKFCPMYCMVDAEYMTCPPNESKPLKPACNCCLAGKGCTIYMRNGGVEKCT